MKIKINFSKRWLYTFIVIGILAIVGVGVWAATYTASGAGHPYTEISTCGDEDILQMIGGEWNCVDMVSGSVDTNADTICTGTYKYLNGDGGCRDVRSDGDLYDTDTHGTLTCTSRSSARNTACNTICSNNGEVCVSTIYTLDGRSFTCEQTWDSGSAINIKCRCCKVT